jgi:superfamily II DNA or RNA helicase
MKNNSQIKGYQYELDVKNYIINKLNKIAYLWKETPEKILINIGIIGSHNEQRLNRKENIENPLQDTGIDIIQIDNIEENKYSLIQCKNGYDNGLTFSDLSGFNAWMAVLDKINGFVYYTNKLSNPIKSLPKNNRIQYIKYINYSHSIINYDNKNLKKIIPFEYQIKASQDFMNYYKNNDRGILSMPCGTGKTFTSYLISQNYNQIIIVSPLKQFAKQNLEKFIEYGYKNKTLLVDSEGERDIEEISKFIKSNESFLISCTYCSIDVIYHILTKTKNPLIIIDEFHNLSKNNILNENDNFNKILYSEHRMLFMSATPRIYELENEEFEYDEIFGKIVFNMTFNEAIKNKYITDYRIWLPSILEDNSKLNNELSIYKIDSIILAKCNYLISCLLNNGSKKCIIYCINTVEIDKMIESIKLINEYYFLEFSINKITSDDSEKKRSLILKSFEESTQLQLLFSIRILDECIDIPVCDSIYITYSSESKIRTIQRLSRCIRIDKLNKFKIGNVFIWCNEYDKIINTLSGIKEYDILFKDKIKINQINFYNENNKETIEKEIQLINKYIIGIKEYTNINWDMKLEKVKKFIINNKRRPSHRDTDNNKIIGKWLETQLSNYKNKEYNMTDIIKYEKFNNFILEFKEYFINNEENWYHNFNELKLYLDNFDKRPSEDSLDINIKKIGKWITDQLLNYKNKTKSMKNKKIYDFFSNFIKNSEYKKYFLSSEESWIMNLELVKKYIDLNNKRPSDVDLDKSIKYLGNWIFNQQKHFKKKDQIMKNSFIQEKWIEFTELSKYNIYF